ncbi:hypothetical protein RJ641_005925 [Dillenia turbinata]|uniref:Uncharacterized protein n=1 Tax=Dillenia turbinata TaxID=194707 RepID=A0AAN8V988_9MAGN
MMCACFGYVAFGNDAPRNMLTGFGFYEPFWVYAQPIYSLVETLARRNFPESKFVMAEYPINLGSRHSTSTFLG